MLGRHTTVQVANAAHPDLVYLGAAEEGCSTAFPHNPNITAQQSPLLQCEVPWHCQSTSGQHLEQHHVHSFGMLLQQLDAVSWQRIAKLSPDLSSLVLRLHDANGRTHTADVQLPAGFPVSAPAVTVHLPKPFKLKWLPGHTLLQLVQQLEQALHSFGELWEQLEDLDHHAQLLDPPQALAHPYSSCRRCIALGKGSSCELQLSVTAPRALPRATFHGPSSVVAGLQAAWYGSAAQQWDEQQSVRQNLETVLQLRLPAPKPGSKKGCAALAATTAAAAAGNYGSQGSVVNAEAAADAAAGSDMSDDDSDYGIGDAGACCICYSLHLADPARPDELGLAPSVSCPGSSCGRVFHAMCLAEWLGALPTSRRVFDTLFGSCPFCNGPIGVSTRPAAQS